MGLKNALKKIVKGGDKKEKKTEEEEASEEIEKEPQEAEAETTIESEASPVPDEVEEEQAKPCRPGMGGLSKQRSFSRRGRRLQMAQEVEANLIDGEECEEKEEQENIPLKDGRRRRRGRRGEGENHDGPDTDCISRHSQRSTSRSLDRASKHTQPSSLDGSSKHSNRSHSDDGEEVVMISIPKKEDVSKSNLRRSRNNSSRTHSRDRLSQRASSRERPAMSRAASRERLSERMAANRSASRERGTRRNENVERMRRSSSRDRGQRRSRRGDGQDVTLPSSQADGKEVVEMSGTTKISTPAAPKPDGTIEVVGGQSSSIRSSRSGVEVSSSVRSSRNEGGKDQGTGRRSTSRGRGRPDRGSAKSNHDDGDSGDRLGRSNHSTGDANEHRHRNSSGDRRRGSSRERRPRRPPRSENASADVSKPPLPPTAGETLPPPPPSANGGERSPVPSTEVHSSKQHEESTTSKEERSAEAKVEIDSNTAAQTTEDSNEKEKQTDSVDLLNMIPYEETKAEEEATARQSVGVVFHSEEPQEGKSDEEEPTEEISDKAEVNPALALLGLLAERDTPETKEKKIDSSPPRSDNSDSGVIAKTEGSPGTEVEIGQKDDLSEAVATDEDKDLGISLPNVEVTISVGNDNAKKDSSKAEAAADSETDPMLSLLGHIGANQLIDEKNSNNTEPTVKSAHQLESSVDFFRGPKNDGASPDTSIDVSQSSRLSTNENSADEQEFGKPSHLSSGAMGNKRVVRRTKSSDGNLSGPSLPPPSLADPNERTKVRRVKRASVKKDESSDLPPPSLAPPSLAGDMMRHINGKKVRRRKIKDGEGEEKTLAPPSLAGDLLAAGGRARKVRRAKSDSGSDLLSANELAPPSLAGDFHAAKVKKKGKKLAATVGGADAAAAEVGENVEKNTKLTRRQEKKAKRFNKLDDDDDDSLGGDIPVENQEAATESRPRRGMLSKARSAANVIEKGVKLGKKSSSSKNLFA